MSDNTAQDYRYPEGIEGALYLYLTSDSTGLNIRVGLTGLKRPIEPKNEIEPTGLLQSFGKDEAISGLADDWRFMTAAEVKEYKEDNDE